MKLGFVSAILADQNLDEVLDFAANEGFLCAGRGERQNAATQA